LQSISTLHFPQFDKLIYELAVAAGTYRGWIYLAVDDQKGNDPEAVSDLRDELWPYVEKREVLLDALKKFAQQHFQ
jgi:hypothetical protein